MSIETALLVERILEELGDYQRHCPAEDFNKAFVLLLDSTDFSFFLGHEAAEVEHANTGEKVGLRLTQFEQGGSLNPKVVLVFAGQEGLQDLLGDMHQLHPDLAGTVIGHHVHELSKFLVMFHILNELGFFLLAELTFSHHHQFLTGHFGVQPKQPIRKPFQEAAIIFFQGGSKRFHIFLEVPLEDCLVLTHEVVLEGDLVGIGKVFVGFLVERILIEHAFIIIGGGCDLLGRGGQALGVLEVVAGEHLDGVEVVLALHGAGPRQIIIDVQTIELALRIVWKRGLQFKDKGFVFQTNPRGVFREEGIGKNNGVSRSASELTTFAFLFRFYGEQDFADPFGQGAEERAQGKI